MRDIQEVQEKILRCDVETHYTLEGDELGSGQTAQVFKAHHRETGKEVAVKMIDKHKTGAILNDKEIAVLFKVDHPYCCKLYEVYETADQVQLVLELLRGNDLFSRIIDRLDSGRKVPYDEGEAAMITKRVALAVQHMHQKGIIHRDLKPENIMMPSETDDLMVKVGDFGLAKLFPHEPTPGLRQSTGTYVGTPGYAPPEILNRDMYSFNVDVWTLGVCCYIILSGCPPFPQNMLPSSVDKIKHADKQLHFPLPQFADVSETAKDFMRTCMNPNPQTRPGIDEILQHEWLKHVNADC